MRKCDGIIFGISISLIMANQAIAQTAANPTGPGAIPDDSKLGSVYLRCDGSPPHRSGAELAGRLLMIMATAGLAGVGEKADTSKRLTGPEAVSACDAAIARETDPIRKVQLTLARSIHHIEAKEYEPALADARAAPALAGGSANELVFRHSLMLSSLELEAAALVRLNRPAEAEAAAIKMAAASPYDLIAQERASRYVGLTVEMTPAKKDYLDRFARIWPKGLFSRATASEWVGDYLAAADDDRAFVDLSAGFVQDKAAVSPQPAIDARRAVALALGGDMTQSNEFAAETRRTIDDLIQTGKALNFQGVINEAEELLDFQSIAALLDAGKGAQARAAFAARSRWVAPTPPAVADLTVKLRKGAAPGELTGALARDPAAIRANGLVARAGAITGAADADTALYAAIRPPVSAGDYSTWDDDVWNTDDSPFLVKKTGKETYSGDFVFLKHANGIATGDALLMHCALLARAQGKAGFVLLPVRTRLDATIVRFGDPGDPGIPARAMNDAATIIAALSVEFPDPKIKTEHPKPAPG